MATFTINSLNTGTPASSDNFLKSDSSGVLTKVPFTTLAEALAEMMNVEVTLKSQTYTAYSNTITVYYLKVGRIVLINITSSGELTGHTANAWNTIGAIPSGIPMFSAAGFVSADGANVGVRYRTVDNVNVLQVRPNAATVYLSGTAVGIYTD